MNQIILTTPEELRAIVSESVSQTLAGLTLPRNEPDNLTPDAAVGVLEQHGFLISKARLYKLTSKGGRAVPQVREQAALLPQGAARVGR